MQTRNVSRVARIGRFPAPTALAAGLVLLLARSASATEAADRFEVNGPATSPVWVVESPAVPGNSYAVLGRVAYEGVAGEAYLEMWSHFPDGSRYFSRTLEASGPLAKLHGTSAERDFALPFHLAPGGPRPTRLEVGVVLPAAGRVIVSGLRFVPDAAAATARGAWWSDRTAGLIGGVAGTVVGMLGAAIGVLCSLGRGRRLVMAVLLALGVSGVALLGAGVVALALGQPYAVWYPLALMGAIDSVVGFTLLPTVRRRFEALDLERARPRDAHA